MQVKSDDRAGRGRVGNLEAGDGLRQPDRHPVGEVLERSALGAAREGQAVLGQTSGGQGDQDAGEEEAGGEEGP